MDALALLSVRTRAAFLAALFAIDFLAATDMQAADQPVIVPAWQRFRASHLEPVEAGRLLISELNCQSCHGELSGQSVSPREAPILTHIAQRTSIDYIRRFIKNPQAEKPGTAMPENAVLKSDPTTVDAIAAFLSTGSSWRPVAVGVDAVRRGEVLFHTVGCAACHVDRRSDSEIEAVRKGQPKSDRPVDEDDADAEDSNSRSKPYLRPDFLMPLGKLEQKYTLPDLISFLRDPHAVRPSGRMPSLNLSIEETRDVASFLLKDVDAEPNLHFSVYEGDWQQLPEFSKLTPKESGKTTDFSVGVTTSKDVFALRFDGYLHLPADGQYQFSLSSDDGSRLLIDGNIVVDNDGVHAGGFRDQEYSLSKGVHEVVVEYFESYGGEELAVEIEGSEVHRQPLAGLMSLTRDPPAVGPDRAAVPVKLIEQGRIAFAQLGCADCHRHGDGDRKLASTVKAPQFAAMKPIGGCLAEQPSAAVPQFSLSSLQRADISAAIDASQQPTTQVADTRRDIHRTMLTLNCYACHTRDAIGGISEPMNHVFTGSIPEMGDEGRVPPNLDGVGDKLNEVWLRTILNEGAKDRPYMATRMPKFGSDHAGVLIPRLVEADRQPPADIVTISEPEHRIKADARLMVGDQSLSCIKCHIFDAFAATGIQSLDLTTMTRRLRHDWFHRYMFDPQKYRPGTRMPAAWPRGRSVVPHILGGDSAVQIEAIWMYLSDGKQAKVPSGLQREAIELTPTDRPIVYRNFIEGLSPRGIAVGFPEKAHFAWDAEHMTPRLIWHGAFIDASLHWSGRGAGNQSPLGDHIMTLPSGPPLAVLSSLDQPWPDANPREHGFRFRGYSLSKHGTPTFRYTWDDAEVTDTITPIAASPDAGLQRVLTVRSTNNRSGVFVRVASGKSLESDEGAFVVDGVRFTFPDVEAVVRTIEDRRELLVPVAVSTDGVATIRYSMIW